MTPATKEFVADAASCGAWNHRILWQVRRIGFDKITPGDIDNAVRVIELSSPVTIEIFDTYPPCGLNTSQEVGNKRE